MQTLTVMCAKTNTEKQVSETIKGGLCILAWAGREAAGRRDGDGWTDLTVRYSSCTLHRTSC